jgi:hypothetical protein
LILGGFVSRILLKDMVGTSGFEPETSTVTIYWTAVESMRYRDSRELKGTLGAHFAKKCALICALV